jgi:hypothetical protein
VLSIYGMIGLIVQFGYYFSIISVIASYLEFLVLRTCCATTHFLSVAIRETLGRVGYYLVLAK